MECPHCGSSNIIRCGFYKYKNQQKQKFKCRSCKKYFNDRRSCLKGFKTRTEIVLFAVDLYIKGESTRDIAVKIKERFGIVRSHVTILNWVYHDEIRHKTSVDSILGIPCFGCKKSCDARFCDELGDWLRTSLNCY